MNKLNDALNVAIERFRDLIDHPNNKFKKLPFWLNYVSYQFKKEKDNNLPTWYYHFDRGAVIRVNFGVNPGSEFSFTHFAVVLDKHDNFKKTTLTVLPLTSKKGKNRYSLGNDIFNQTVTLLSLQVDDIQKKAVQLKNKKDLKSSEIDYAIEDAKELSKVIEVYKDFNKETYVRIGDITTISKLRIKRLNKFDPSGRIKLSQKQMKEISLAVSKAFLDKL
ncbi:type II toxin-antitoxin system PemK/MazF family toxin [uncultured Lactobacillus sp.]|uniref:type II toxin-antitoxin system PemK/MazF family toxin n=1 Tax=uncultured Lactobacillus sp. TaxID=153152 RepID=UPI0025860D93|nr:type II toxin-antitoxin system PemK/MazF family toxin [uncultured Lactobacillus sp.]